MEEREEEESGVGEREKGEKKQRKRKGKGKIFFKKLPIKKIEKRLWRFNPP